MDENVNNRLIIMGVVLGTAVECSQMTEREAKQILRSSGYPVNTPDYLEDLEAVLVGMGHKGLIVREGETFHATDKGIEFAETLQGIVNPFGR